MDKKLNIVVVCGGISSEREVSLRSGKSVYDALREYGYENIFLFDLQKDNFAELIELKPDICFLALHGKGGEDGSIQGALETLGIKYTFSGVEASAIAMDKIITKKVFAESNIPTADFICIDKNDFENIDQIEEHIVSAIELPFVVKAPLEGSSIGVEIVKEASAIKGAIENALAYGARFLIEKYIDGIEVTVPVMGNDEPFTLPLIEITSENSFYDYESKYTPGMCRHIIPARISGDIKKACEKIALDAFRALGCRGLARIDMMIDNEKGPMVMEVNTIPGMTAMSLVPDSARAMGIEFPEFCAKCIEYGYLS